MSKHNLNKPSHMLRQEIYILSMDDLTKLARDTSKTLVHAYSGESLPKHLLNEMARRLDVFNVRVDKKKDGYLLINNLGSSRFLTWRETIAYKLSGVLPLV